MKESDLYPPLKTFLESKAYGVKAEVKQCDVLATKEGEQPIIVELKLSINLTVILQAVDRLALSPNVYIGIPKACKTFTKQRKRLLKLLRMLGIGLILIDSREHKQSIEIVLTPTDYKPRQSSLRQKRLLKEFATREGDPNMGGMATKEGVVTAYRQQALRIAEYLNTHGVSKASIIAKALDEPKAREILYKNYYGWFENTARGIYGLTPEGINATTPATPASS